MGPTAGALLAGLAHRGHLIVHRIMNIDDTYRSGSVLRPDGDLIVFADPPTLAYGENVKLKNLTKDGSERSISLHTGTRNLSNVSAKELLLRKSLVESTLRLED